MLRRGAPTPSPANSEAGVAEAVSEDLDLPIVSIVVSLFGLTKMESIGRVY